MGKNIETATAAEVRQWLRDQGKTVGTRGRLSAEHVAEFQAATGKVYA